ncbi:MAG: ABC transporter ATP-binding protein [Dehalococcoidia bacterium]|nr:ABC transporter ATP-binding protein [Dehalococcoidia bacterium]
MMSGGFGGGGWMRGGGSFRRGPGGRLGMDREEYEDGRIYNHRVVTRLFGYVLPHRARLLLTLAAVMVYTATVVALPWMVATIIDDYVRTGDLPGLNVVVPIFVGLALLQYGSQYVQLRTMAYVGQKVLYALRVGLFRHLQKLSMKFYNRNEVGRVMSRVQNDVGQLQEFLSIVVMTIADVLSLGGIITAMALMNARLAAITLSIIPVLVVMMVVWQRYARRAFMRARQAISAVNASLQENISGVRVVQSMNRENANIHSFGSANSENLGANLEAVRMQAVLFPSVEFLSAFGLALVIVFGGSLVLEDAIEVGVLVAFALYIQRFFEPVLNLTMQYGSLQRAMASGARIFELMDVEPELVDRPDSLSVETVNGDVKFRDVSFQYIEEEPILRNVDLHVPAGHTVALVGPTGAGKTTIVSLLMRFYDVSEGRVLLDDTDIRDITIESLTKQIAVVPQEPYLFSGTIRENIRYNRTRASDEDVVGAAKAVGAHDFIVKMEKGYDTPLQERGGNLSVGQRQLISFARALVADPRVLLLDEATANIDTYTETLIQRALDELLRKRTAIVIAHRLSTIRNADRIVVLDQGRIVEEGRHDELVAGGGLYSRLYSYSDVGADSDSASAIAVSTNGAAGFESPSGIWNVKLESPRGTREGVLELVADGSSLSGTWTGERDVQRFAGGTVEGSDLTWEVRVAAPMGELSLGFTGVVTNGILKGDVAFGSFGKGRFEAKRAGAE